MFKEETINALTHGLGALLGLGGLAVLVVTAARHGDPWHIVSCSIYGATLVLLYASSTLYHGCRGERAKHICRIIDHASSTCSSPAPTRRSCWSTCAAAGAGAFSASSGGWRWRASSSRSSSSTASAWRRP